MAVRRPSGEIETLYLPLSSLYSGPLRRVPLLRGVLVLVETLVMGFRALQRSTAIAYSQAGEELSGPGLALSGILALVIAISLFFLLPLLLARSLGGFLNSTLLVNLVEGLIRLLLFLGYIKLMGLMAEVRRVFAYHGAEHMTIHAYEAGEPLVAERVRRFSTAHPRCGTAFLLVVMVVSLVVFSILGHQDLLWSALYRVLLVPLIAAVSYEVIRWSGAHQGMTLVRLVTAPSLALQALTTRPPDEGQIRVAIAAMEKALEGDGIMAPATDTPTSGQEKVTPGPVQPQGDAGDPSP
ncbi:MAG: DUF1385 domain-containing protein [Chloroflexi bacterium]|nr:DUF1385 domain-containing protein [Chloroflexota bacterium]